MPPSQFSTLPLSAALLDAVKSLGYTEMTPVQAHALPALLAGKDVIAQADTGTGKTAAFALGSLARVDLANPLVQSLIICPTRELAEQVSKEIRRLARLTPNVRVVTLTGGVQTGPQRVSLKGGAHIVVGTPGRLQEHLEKGALRLEGLKMLVLDEADRMLEMGFEAAIREIVAHAPSQRQTLLFSATFPDAIRKMSAGYQDKPVSVTVQPTATSALTLQRFYEVSGGKRADALLTLLLHHGPESALVFCNTKNDCRELLVRLTDRGFAVLALHGDLLQPEREHALTVFSNGTCTILVATDVAARGLDIKELELVVNYNLSPMDEVHLHRIGRTGRAGRQGLALSLFTPGERHRLAAFEETFQIAIEPQQLPATEADAAPRLPRMSTVRISGGRNDKLRPGDILGALTTDAGIPGQDIGKIDIFDRFSYVAIARTRVSDAVARFTKIKGRRFKLTEVGLSAARA